MDGNALSKDKAAGRKGVGNAAYGRGMVGRAGGGPWETKDNLEELLGRDYKK
jgi:hypothetical protein